MSADIISYTPKDFAGILELYRKGMSQMDALQIHEVTDPHCYAFLTTTAPNLLESIPVAIREHIPEIAKLERMVTEAQKLRELD